MKQTPAELHPHGQPRIHTVAEFGDLATCIELDRLFARYTSLENRAEAQNWPDDLTDRAMIAKDQYNAAYDAAKLRWHYASPRRLVAIGDKTGVTATSLDWDAEVFALADYDETMDAASYRAQ